MYCINTLKVSGHLTTDVFYSMTKHKTPFALFSLKVDNKGGKPTIVRGVAWDTMKDATATELYEQTHHGSAIYVHARLVNGHTASEPHKDLVPTLEPVMDSFKVIRRNAKKSKKSTAKSKANNNQKSTAK